MFAEMRALSTSHQKKFNHQSGNLVGPIADIPLNSDTLNRDT